jgi:WD40 repeat protein
MSSNTITGERLGRPLSAAMSAGGVLPASAVTDVLLGLAQALRELHASGRVHRCVTPDTVHWDAASGAVTLAPSSAVVELGGPQADPDLTPPALRGDTPIRLPAERDTAQRALDAAGITESVTQIDLYQFGTLACRLLTDEPVAAYLCSPRTKGKVPRGLQTSLDRALGFNPKDRFASAAELATALKQVCAGVSAPDRVPTTVGDTDPSLAGIRGDTSLSESARGSPGSAGVLPFTRLGHYEVLARIGHGGMGDVYRGYERALDRAVAIKVLPAELAREPEFVRRFYAEASAAARVVHPHVIPIHYIGEDQGHHFFAMQYVEGESLAALLARRERLTVDEALELLEQVLAGLGAAHRQGLIHRDIKPGNILLDRVQHRAVLADFGLVKSLREGEGPTATGVVLGTVDYLSPEQGRGQAVDHRSDLYALGVVLYQMLSGQLPFTADSPTALIFQHVYERPRPLTEVAPETPPALAAVVAKLLAKSPADRHADAQGVLADLAAVRAGRPLPSGADAALARDAGVFARPSVGAGPPRTVIVTAPQFAEEPWLPAESPVEAAPSPEGWWGRVKARLGAAAQEHAPELVQRLANTQQQVDLAVAEYERRRERLAAVVQEAEGVLADLRTQEGAWREAAARPGDTSIRTADELGQAIAGQEEQLATMRLRLAKVNATLEQLRSQRNVLNARLRAAQARQHVAGGRVRKTLLERGLSAYKSHPRFAVALGLAVVLALSVAAFPPMKSAFFHEGGAVPDELGLLPGESRPLQGDAHQLYCLAVSPDEQKVASAGAGGTVRLWSLKSLQQEFVIPGIPMVVTAMAFSHDGRTLAFGGVGGDLYVADINRRTTPRSFPNSQNIFNAAEFLPDGRLLTACGERLNRQANSLRIWNVETGTETRTFATQSDRIAAINVSRDGKYVLTGGHDTSVRLYGIADGVELQRFRGHTDRVLGVALSDDMAYAAGCGADRTVRIWSVETGELLQTLRGHRDDVYSVVFINLDANVVSTGADATVRIWNRSGGPELYVARSHTQMVRMVRALSGGRTLLTASADSTLRIWNVAEPSRLVSSMTAPEPTPPSSVADDRHRVIPQANDATTEKRIATSPDGATMVSSDFTRDRQGKTTVEMKVWNLRTGSALLTLKQPHQPIGMCISADGTRLASAGIALDALRPETCIWDLSSGERLQNVPLAFRHFRQDTVSLALSADGKVLFCPVGTDAVNLARADLETATVSTIKLPYQDSATGTAVAPLGNVAAIARLNMQTDDVRVEVYELSTGRMRLAIPATNHVRALGLSQDGAVLAGSVWGRLLVWDTQDGSTLAEFTNMTSLHNKVIVSADGKFVAGLKDGVVEVADVTVKQSHVLQTKSDCLDIAFGPDHSLVVTMTDSPFKFFNPTTGNEQLLPTGAN